MATYPPPNFTEPLSVFNPANWETIDLTLTIENADKRYLKYPVAQGLETLQQIIVNGTATLNGATIVNANLDVSGNTILNNDLIVRNQITLQDPTNPNTNYTDIIAQPNGTLNINTNGNGVPTNPSIAFAINNVNWFALNSANGFISFNAPSMNINTTNPPICSATQPAFTDSSTKIPTTAWVQGAISTGGLLTYTNKYTGNYPNGSPLTITIPTGCVKFDVILFGTGGLSTSYSIGVPDFSHIDYYYQIPATGGGAQVVKSTSSILIGKQGTNATNTMLLNTQIAISGGATGSQLSLNSVILAQAVNGNNATSFSNAGTATTSTHTTNSNFTSWIISQGNAGVGSNESYSSPNVGQLGGGNTYGGIAGAGSFGTNQQNASGAGQLYGSLSGPSYGLFVYPASPVNYGGCYITWYIQN